MGPEKVPQNRKHAGMGRRQRNGRKYSGCTEDVKAEKEVGGCDRPARRGMAEEAVGPSVLLSAWKRGARGPAPGTQGLRRDGAPGRGSMGPEEQAREEEVTERPKRVEPGGQRNPQQGCFQEKRVKGLDHTLATSARSLPLGGG